MTSLSSALICMLAVQYRFSGTSRSTNSTADQSSDGSRRSSSCGCGGACHRAHDGNRHRAKCILSSENPWYCHKNSLVVANRIPWSLPNKIPGSATLLHPHEGVSQAVAWTIKSNQVAMVGQTVNHGSRHLVIGKNGAPFGKLQIGGNDQAAPFVAA